MAEKETLIEWREGRANCWKPRQPRSGGPDWIGVTALAGKKFWIYLRCAETADGRQFIKVELQEKVDS